MKKIGLYGGSFDPVHIGHLLTATNVLETLSLDKLIFIPSNITPLKDSKLRATNEERFKMIKLSILSMPKFEVNDYEISRQSVSYTYNTVKYFKKIYPNVDLYFIIGTDRVRDLNKWYRIDELSKLVTFIFVARDSDRLEEIVEESEFYNSIKYVILNLPIIEISSSMIRDKIKNLQSVEYLLEKDCLRYIEEKSLYEISRNTRKS
ncbi:MULTISPECIES: nicotinate (nicotinamide) nucleotide adenylyltransferase [unclassified Gemella]|uniref:nicotinate (nicotinamide) nucleotide adenylyltransferase n=1 Tax=unclassified Gemella TaxID=2624949 RepID=UPI0010748FB2|nr:MULTISPECIES: nicotinate (nicotinamide) nucleotide adenylyltransferase [unclassified Gemella]MBF0710721.1 nicotinate (nicotinamide) nucleotide adenylyltransferase [Gemella sp. GL1.1]MBF0746710.1 nicotinate (nicotinamide) nucleotide adenylyltransferase [Gemella sp. 19428wG2_WT2a]NYS28065.1 nicotinate (nicotinamide) nucleotide adenylyltransferase [Gemella sp. GL1]TFU60059.1 nicotinate (nicotinamide) nucleotide adenylyltransferase [Gemella sp. WT2a]